MKKINWDLIVSKEEVLKASLDLTQKGKLQNIES